MRGRDLITLGLNGHRFGLPLTSREGRRIVAHAVEEVDAGRFADDPVGNLSGGEQQRIRVAQALVSDPALLLCDEPLISLDLHHQQVVSQLIDRRRRTRATPVIFITHDINPVLSMTDRILYLADGRHRVGTPDEILRSEVLSELYGARVDVLRIEGRVVVIGVPDQAHHPEEYV
jgi:zinc/manganese transport system ATP-binding protein